MQNLRLTPDLLNHNLHLNKIPRGFVGIFKIEKQNCIHSATEEGGPLSAEMVREGSSELDIHGKYT